MARALRIAAVVAPVLLACAFLSAQRSPGGPPFRVSVDMVHVDAVVIDSEGRIISDLTPADFEVLQNGRRQKVAFAEFVPIAPAVRTAPVTRAGDAGALPPSAPPPPLKREQVQRTWSIVLDDLGLSFESIYYAKRGLHGFVDEHLRDGDLVGMVRTGGTTVQPFTSDRRILHAAIDGMRWNGFLSRSGVSAFPSINKTLAFDTRTAIDLEDTATFDSGRSSVIASGTLGALNMAIRAIRELPGRKALVFVSEGFSLIGDEGLDSRLRIAVDRVIDQAARSGVIIYSLDPRGLQTAGFTAEDHVSSRGADAILSAAAQRRGFFANTQDTLRYLAEQTGGLAVLNTNDLSHGLGRISADLRDYYVIGYVPEEGTFVRKNGKVPLHNVTVKVRRPGLRVRTRKAFLGRPDVNVVPAADTPAQRLVRAALSPFAASEIGLSATTVPRHTSGEGLFVRTLLHVDARSLTFTDDAEGRKTASGDVLGLIFDRDGAVVAQLDKAFSAALTSAATDDALRDGLGYSLHVPVPRPGGYQFRFAIRDRSSGKIGTAGAFVDLPDIPKGAFAVSGVVLRRQGGGPTPASDPLEVSAADAVRHFPAGAQLAYAYEVYNAVSEVRASVTLWRGPQLLATVSNDRLAPPAGKGARFAVRGGLKLSDGLPAGDYTLQLAAASQNKKGPPVTSSRVVDFRVE